MDVANDKGWIRNASVFGYVRWMRVLGSGFLRRDVRFELALDGWDRHVGPRFIAGVGDFSGHADCLNASKKYHVSRNRHAVFFVKQVARQTSR